MDRKKFDVKDSLLLRNPELAAEWDYEKNGELKPHEVLMYSKKKVFWKCKICGQGWLAVICNRSNGNGCPYCAGNKVLVGVNDLKTLYPHIAAQWDFKQNGEIKPSDFKAKSNKAVYWICDKCNQAWLARITTRTRGTGCPYCSGQKVLEGVNDLATLYPHIAAQWDFKQNGRIKSTNIAAKSSKAMYWICDKCNQSWLARIYSRTQGSGCPYCSGRKAIEGVNDLKTVYSHIATQWDYEKNGKNRPSDFLAKSNKEVYWICGKCNQSWLAMICSRTQGTGCPYCSSKITLEGVNDLKTLYPHISAQWDYSRNGEIKPTSVTANSAKEVYWKCDICNQSWIAKIYNRTRGTGCPYCSSKKTLEGVNDLKTLNPYIAAQWDYANNRNLLPSQLTEFSSKKVFWICDKCGNRWRSTISNRVLGKGCPECYGYKKTVSKNV
ncbi:MAG: hypothetical protein K0S24_3986 [Sphingobacterium sp.]|jgi:DNA-directed RNA polymerase subunit RPC12/RpoP|nr:hypothetical protein [Sphingobacterium sp.]